MLRNNGKSLAILGGVTAACLSVATYWVMAGEYRFWTTANGRRSDVKLEAVEQADGRVKLRRADNGRIVELPLSQLSSEDQRYLRETKAAGTAPDNNWPRFRGSSGQGLSDEVGLPLEWSGTKNIAWKTSLPGPGSSSPIVFGDHVYVTCYSGYGLSLESPGSMVDLKHHLVCLDREGGKILWTATIAPDAEVTPFTDPIAIGKHGYASSTPAADASGVYVYYGSSGAAAYSHAGERKWHASCGKETHIFGSGTSPILHGDLLIVHAEIESHSLVALDKATGRERWRQPKTGGEGNTWSTPNVFEVAGRAELVYPSAYGQVAAIDPDNGATLWEFDAQIRRINPTIIQGDGLYLALGGPNGKAVALEVDRSRRAPAIEVKWELNKSSYITSPVYHEGHFYWANDGNGIAYCVNVRSGKLVYQERFVPVSGDIYASPVVADGRIYYVSRDRGAFVVPAGAEFKMLAHNVIESDDSMFNGSPAVSRGKLFLRSDKFLYCIGGTR